MGTRRTDWPEQLARVVREAESKKFGRGYFCAVLAADCVRAMTGTDPMVGYRGLSQKKATAKLAANGYTFEGYLEKLFGPPEHLAFAQRGDIALRYNDGAPAIGPCLGSLCAFPTDVGVTYLPTLEQVHIYKVR